MKLAKSCKPCHRFSPGVEWEILHTDAVLLLGLTHALRCATRLWRAVLLLITYPVVCSESYKGYLQCLSVLYHALILVRR